MSYSDFLGVVADGRKNVTTSRENVMPAVGDNPNVACYMGDIYVYFVRAPMTRWAGFVRPNTRTKRPPRRRQRTPAWASTEHADAKRSDDAEWNTIP